MKFTYVKYSSQLKSLYVSECSSLLWGGCVAQLVKEVVYKSEGWLLDSWSGLFPIQVVILLPKIQDTILKHLGGLLSEKIQRVFALHHNSVNALRCPP